MGRPAHRLFELALARKGLSPRWRAILEDNFGQALERDGRHDEAFEHRRRSASFFRQEGLRYDLFKTLLNLSAHFARLGRQADLDRTFEEAHDVIHALSAEQVDVDHYRQLESRIREAEGAESTELERGRALLDLGRRHLGAGRYGAAERALLEAGANLMDAAAVHSLIQVDVALGELYTNAGQSDDAGVRLRSARDLAHGLGDAWFECLALINLSRLNGELDPLELIARARALRFVALEQALPAEMREDSYMRALAPDRGVLESRELDICLERGALRLAQRYCQQSVDLAESLRGHQRYRLSFRLVKLLHILDRRERAEHADAVMNRLRRLCAESDDPRVCAATQHADGRRRLERGTGHRRRLRCWWTHATRTSASGSRLPRSASPTTTGA